MKCLSVLGFAVAASTSNGQTHPPTVMRPPQTSASNTQFGASVACNGDTLVIGAPDLAVGGNLYQGTAHVFRWGGSAWMYEASLVAEDAGSNDFFGRSISLQGDTVIVGAPGDTVGGSQTQGSAYIFQRTGMEWKQQAKLLASDGVEGDNFGGAVAISGETAIVGVRLKTIGGKVSQGAAYVYVRNGSAWTEQIRLTAGDGASGDNFGCSVALFNNTAVVGSMWDDIGVNVDQGSAYAYVRQGSTWTQVSKLVSPDGRGGDSFGTAVAFNSEVIVCGAPLHDLQSPNNGAAYTYVPDGVVWRYDAKISPSGLPAHAFFGISLAIHEDEVLAGATGDFVTGTNQGSAYLHAKTPTGWVQRARFRYPNPANGESWGHSVGLSSQTAILGAPFANTDSTPKGLALVYSRAGDAWAQGEVRSTAQERQAQSYLGISVAIDGEYAVAGANQFDSPFTDQGAIYVFARSKAWQNLTFFPLVASDAAANDRFGSSVAINGDTLISGAPQNDLGPVVDAGSAYIFVRGAGENWTQQGGPLIASDGVAGDNLGNSVAIDGDTAILGAPGDDTGSVFNHGCAYIFQRSGTNWSQATKLLAPDFTANDNFGFSVDIHGGIAVVGAYSKDGRGAAYVFRRELGTFVFAQKLTATDSAAGDSFGVSVAVQGDGIIVGAFGKNALQGAAYVFVQAGTTWSQVAKLTAPGGAAGDGFGRSVDISGSNAVVGAFGKSAGGQAIAGAVYCFTSISATARGPWVYQANYSPSPSAPNQYFGYAAAISGTTMVSGSSWADDKRGSLRFFDVLDAEQMTVLNQSTGLGYSDLEAGLAAQLDAQRVLASAGTFGLVPGITLGNRTLRSRSSIAIPYTAPLALNGGAIVTAASGYPIDIYGSVQTPASGSATLGASEVRFGELGSVFINAGELVLHSPSAEFNGATTVRSGTAMVSNSGDLIFRGTLNMPVGGSIAAGEIIELRGTSILRNPIMTAGETLRIGGFTTATTFVFGAPTIQVPAWGQLIGGGTLQGSVVNSGKIIISATTNVIGAFTNDANASITYSGVVFSVFGRFLNYGTMTPGGNPSGCPSCMSNPSSLIVQDTFALGETASLYGASVLEIGGGFESFVTDPLRLDLRSATLRMNSAVGRGGIANVEVMSKDRGSAGAATRLFVPGGFPIGTLELGPAPTVVTLVDNVDNDGMGQTIREALYVDSLVVPAGSRLNTAGIRVYARSAVIEGVVDRPSNILPLPPACDADLAVDSVVDDSDFEVFAGAYALVDCADPAMAPASRALRGGCPADLDHDGLVDDADFTFFLSAYQALVCP